MADFHLFSYGTLRSAGGAPARQLRGCELVGSAVISGALFDIGPYPALLLAGDDPVEGEIWRCPADLLAGLDQYEGVAAGLFRRVGVRVAGYACWVYVAGPALGPRLTPHSRIRSDRRA